MENVLVPSFVWVLMSWEEINLWNKIYMGLSVWLCLLCFEIRNIGFDGGDIFVFVEDDGLFCLRGWVFLVELVGDKYEGLKKI